MFKKRLKNFLDKVLGVDFDEAKYNESLIDNLAEEAYLIVTEFIFRDLIGVLAGKLEEKFLKVRQGAEGNSWLSPFLEEFRDELYELFERHSVENGMIEGNYAKLVLLSFLKLIQIPSNEKDLFLFDRMVENRLKHVVKGKQIKYLKLSFNQFVSLLEEWASKENISQKSFDNSLQNIIKELNEVTSSSSPTKLTPILTDLTKKLKNLNSSFHSKPQNSSNSYLEVRVKSLKEIFNFYARQIKMLGNKPTFDEITEHQNLLNISKFTKFCQDFGITNKDNKDHLTVQQVTQAFLLGNECSRIMNFSQFIDSLDRLAEIYYNEQYDARNSTSVSRLKINEKRKMLYEFLQLENRNEYMQRAKGFGLPFSKEKAGFRIPEYDLSKKYKFRDMTERKLKVTEWRNKKNSLSAERMLSKIPPQVSPARLIAVKNSLLQRKDRVTWDILKGSNQLSSGLKEDISSLFTDNDKREILSTTRKNYK